MNIEHISVSRKQCLDECPQKYKYKYHLKMISEGPEPVHFGYGKTVHKIAEEYVRCKGGTSIEEISNEVLNGNILIEANKKAEPLNEYYKNVFPDHVKNIKKITDKIGFDGYLEYKFEYDLDPPSGKIATGFIDRLIVRNDKFFILDYKTTKQGKFRKDRNTIKKDIQMNFYAKVVQKYFDAKAENIHAALYYLDGGDLVSTKFTQSMLDDVEQNLLDSYDKIVEMEPDSVIGNVGRHCFFCDYKKVCPWVKSQ